MRQARRWKCGAVRSHKGDFKARRETRRAARMQARPKGDVVPIRAQGHGLVFIPTVRTACACQVRFDGGQVTSPSKLVGSAKVKGKIGGRTERSSRGGEGMHPAHTPAEAPPAPAADYELRYVRAGAGEARRGEGELSWSLPSVHGPPGGTGEEEDARGGGMYAWTAVPPGRTGAKDQSSAAVHSGNTKGNTFRTRAGQ